MYFLLVSNFKSQILWRITKALNKSQPTVFDKAHNSTTNLMTRKEISFRS